MSTIKQSEICFACEENKGRHWHHVIPVTYDGKEDGKQVLLCPTCHDLIHAEAEHFVKTGEFEQELTDNQTILANYIVQAKLRFMASGKKKADNARNMVQVSLSNQELIAVHALKKKLGFKSLERLLKHLILESFIKNR